MSQRDPFPHKAMLLLHPLQRRSPVGGTWPRRLSSFDRIRQLCWPAWWGKTSHIGFVLGKQNPCTALGQDKFLWRAPAWCSPVHNGSWWLAELLLQALRSAAVPAGVWLFLNHLLTIFLHHCNVQSLKPAVMNLMFPFFYGIILELFFLFSPPL